MTTDPNAPTLREAATKYAAHFGHDGCGPVCDCGFQDLRSALAADAEEKREIVAVLREIEWSRPIKDYRRTCIATEAGCPVCGEACRLGHANDCRLAALLAKLEGTQR